MVYELQHHISDVLKVLIASARLKQVRLELQTVSASRMQGQLQVVYQSLTYWHAPKERVEKKMVQDVNTFIIRLKTGISNNQYINMCF